MNFLLGQDHRKSKKINSYLICIYIYIYIYIYIIIIKNELRGKELVRTVISQLVSAVTFFKGTF